MQSDQMMKERAYNVQDEEKADMEFREKEKCLENGDQSDNGSRRSPKDPKGKNSKLANLSQHAKALTSKRSTLAIALLCVLLFIFFIIIIALAIQIGQLSRKTDSNSCNTPECLLSAAHVAAKLNTSIDPCENFWEYACGGWLQKHPLPRRKGSLSVLDQVREKVRWKIRHQIDVTPRTVDNPTPEGLVKDFYGTCLDINGQAEFGAMHEFKSWVGEMYGWDLFNPNNWAPSRFKKEMVLQRLHTYFGVTPFFKITVEPDDRDREKHIIKILPSGLSLPSKHFYGAESKYETMYKEYLDSFARQLGATPEKARSFASVIIGYEKRIAEVSPPPEAYRQPERFYHKLTVHDLKSLAPTIAWKEILQLYYPSADVQEQTEIAIFDQNYFSKLSEIFSTTDDKAMQHYFMWHFASHYAMHLSSDFRKLSNQFYQKLEGASNVDAMAQDRWEQCLDLTNKFFGHALGAMYAKFYYLPEFNKESELVESQIKDYFTKSIDRISWADDTVTAEAIKEKMETMVSLRGYPDFIYNPVALANYYIGFAVHADYLHNIVNGQKFLRRKEEALLNKQVNSESSWTISPQEVTSLYQYYGNNLVIPAGLLQTPIFDPAATNAVKFGSLGTILGSQMFKAYDDMGITYNELGVLDSWLKGRSETLYKREATCTREKLGNETLYGSIPVKGQLVLGETMADLAAVKFAYKAYKNTPTPNEELPGISQNSDELFFISYAQSMCQSISQDKVRSLSEYSTSSPNEIRVVRTLQQLPEFSEAFQCSAGSFMNPRNKCGIW